MRGRAHYREINPTELPSPSENPNSFLIDTYTDTDMDTDMDMDTNQMLNKHPRVRAFW
jgi:hypothetical protein